MNLVNRSVESAISHATFTPQGDRKGSHLWISRVCHAKQRTQERLVRMYTYSAVVSLHVQCLLGQPTRTIALFERAPKLNRSSPSSITNQIRIYPLTCTHQRPIRMWEMPAILFHVTVVVPPVYEPVSWSTPVVLRA
jgi:hypothetical protein